ncbi:hypothetical protein PFMALIP_03511 [Plasmodium falciparum MaliPS096_E11]|uniref:Uncharacterized protein n=1 Tax=Plasmodium falciparum MaliPS096_E11 TaxID=1036727 RepID=A0A024WNJ8_PLAFA|nr:hypothetical protein PFMALIP_03511 [Plasmodium falciparum MaliPS096_E11]
MAHGASRYKKSRAKMRWKVRTKKKNHSSSLSSNKHEKFSSSKMCEGKKKKEGKINFLFFFFSNPIGHLIYIF